MKKETRAYNFASPEEIASISCGPVKLEVVPCKDGSSKLHPKVWRNGFLIYVGDPVHSESEGFDFLDSLLRERGWFRSEF
jgi:hypothetical protein